MSERQVRFEVPLPGGRLDLALVVHVPDLSRTRLQQLIRSGLVKIDGVVITKPGLRLDGGEAVEVIIPAPTLPTLQAEQIPLDIIFENDDLLLVNKPAGMVVHPSVGHYTGTLVHAALGHSPDMEGVGGEVRPGVVHRLDKDTSGLILLAKNDAAHQQLQRQFKDRSVEKVYLALVDGRPPTPSGRIEAPIGRDPRHRKRMAVVHAGKGREAITIYHTIESFSEHSLLEVHPKTGRTHQIRVHLAFINCPVVGDREYGRRRPTLPIERQFLHAASLTIRLPGEATSSSFETSLPSELEVVLDDLRRR
ncbi:MAG: RluA family pseudouridine synthase [Anaerolineales bacterium]|nr:MAG: RluA family pseudouridine synthase [Anaerolineales bacterium]